MIVFRKKGTRVLSPRILELSMPTDSGPGQKTLRLEGGAVIESKKLRTLHEYTQEMDRAMAGGFVPMKRAPTAQPAPAEPQNLELFRPGMGTAFRGDYVGPDDDYNGGRK